LNPSSSGGKTGLSLPVADPGVAVAMSNNSSTTGFKKNSTHIWTLAFLVVKLVKVYLLLILV